MPTDPALRPHVRALLTEPQAHRTFDDAVAGLAPADRGARPEALPYSVWELVEHLRRAQRDLLDYCRDPDYQMPDWPGDFWPEGPAPPDDAAWTESITRVRADRDAMVDLVMDESVDLYDPVPTHDEHTYLRAALLVADHTAYHVGQIVVVRRGLNAWPPEETS